MRSFAVYMPALRIPGSSYGFGIGDAQGVLQMRLLRRAYLLPSASTQAQPIYGFRLLASSGSEKTCKMIALGPYKFLLCSQFPA
jgi:hypothetical protein